MPNNDAAFNLELAVRTILIALALTIASTVSAQSGVVWYGGPYAPSRVAPTYNYYNASAPVYPVAANPFGAGYYGGWRQQVELRRIRWTIENAAYRPITTSRLQRGQ